MKGKGFLVLLHFEDIAFFLQTEGLGQPCVEQIYQHYLSNKHLLALRLCVTFGKAHNISKLFNHYCICYDDL